VLDFEAIRIEPDAADQVARDPTILSKLGAGRFRRVPRKKLSHAQQAADARRDTTTLTLVSVP